MSDEPRIPNRRFPLLLWILLAVVVLAVVGAFLPVGSRPIIDKARRIDIETAQIRSALQEYEATFGAFPVGDSAAVFRALRGQNPEHLVFFQCRAESVSPDGILLDPWGTPYKLYFSSNEIIIRSAGPNREFDSSGDKHFDDYIR